MTTKALAVLATKLSGIVCIVVALSRLPNAIRQCIQSVYSPYPGTGLLPLAAGASFVLIAAAGLLLLFKGDSIGAFLARSDDGTASTPDSDAWLSTGIALVGIWVMATALPVALERLAYVVMLNKLDVLDGFTTGERITGLFGYSLQFVFGLWLFLGNRGLVGLRNRMRGSPATSGAQQSAGGDGAPPPPP